MAENNVVVGFTDSETLVSDDEDWVDEDEGDEKVIILTKCLFCDKEFRNPEESFSHCVETHTFDISVAKEKFGLDCFSYIKMVNYCRKFEPDPDQLKRMSPDLWQAEDHLTPVVQDDGLLQYDIEECDQRSNECCGSNGEASHSVQELQKKCAAAEQRANHAEEALNSALSDLAKMKEVAQSFMIGDTQDAYVIPSHESIRNLKEGDDDTYFDSYGHFSIHQEMLSDTARTKFYHDCIYASKDFFKNKVVLDIGCGTGILSMFAASAGAKQVIGVEMSDIFYQAVDIIKENDFEDKVQLLKGRMEDVTLPVDKVDIIISEWMGYFLLFESMLDTVLWARDKYLSQDGYVLPNSCSIIIAGLKDKSVREKNVLFWDSVYGFKMSCMKTAVIREASVTSVNASSVCTEMCTIQRFDLLKSSIMDLEFEQSFQLKATSDAELTALVGYFDIFWETKDFSSTCSTSPFVEPTHWKQTVFLLESPIAVRSGDVLEGTISCSKIPKDPRSLKIVITFQGRTLKYYMQ